MTTANGIVRRLVNNYWKVGVVSGLIIIDCVVLCLCTVDAIRFAFSGLSLASAWRVTTEAAADGKSVGLAIATLAFFVLALPMVMALLSTLLSPSERWPRLLGSQGKGLLPVHILLSTTIALFTMLAVTMEVLSGWAKNESWGYSFVSSWLFLVFLGKPAYVAFVSPIVRKFLIRASAERNTTLKSVAVEVLSEETVERRAG
jgi:hypothetical protein